MSLDLKNSPPPTIRRLAGLGIAFGGGFVTWLVWRQATNDGQFSLYGAIAGPGFAMLGLGLVLFPGYREERLRRGEDISQLEGLALLTPRWHAVLGASGLAAVLNLGLLKGWW
jgi:hypothetical protein